MTKALFAGSFDPFTIGHQSIVERALRIFPEVVIAVGINPDKKGFLSPERRISIIWAVFKDEPRVSVVSYSGLTTGLAKQLGAGCIIRGVRSAIDFEKERDLADINRCLTGIETLLLYSLPQYSAVSSSAVRELIAFRHDPSPFLPKNITIDMLTEKP